MQDCESDQNVTAHSPLGGRDIGVVGEVFTNEGGDDSACRLE